MKLTDFHAKYFAYELTRCCASIDVEKLRLQGHFVLDWLNDQLWRLTRQILIDYARFEEDCYSFVLHTNSFPSETIHPVPYRTGKAVEEANTVILIGRRMACLTRYVAGWSRNSLLLCNGRCRELGGVLRGDLAT